MGSLYSRKSADKFAVATNGLRSLIDVNIQQITNDYDY
jgi:hypothetical protein